MNLFQLNYFDGQAIGLVSALPRVTTADVEKAHVRYAEYHSEHTSSSDSDPIDFEEWCKIYAPELGLVRVFVQEVTLADNLI